MCAFLRAFEYDPKLDVVTARVPNADDPSLHPAAHLPAESCPFCRREGLHTLLEWPLGFAILDRFPVNQGHALLIATRHVPTWFDATIEEQRALCEAIGPVRKVIEKLLVRVPDGWNVGFNAGEAAGQTVAHLHIHLIPRWRGDVVNPRGGIRGVVPERRMYPEGEHST